MQLNRRRLPVLILAVEISNTLRNRDREDGEHNHRQHDKRHLPV
jgi:hypothetical protein